MIGLGDSQPFLFAGSQGAKATVSGVLACSRVEGALQSGVHSVQEQAEKFVTRDSSNGDFLRGAQHGRACATMGPEVVSFLLLLFFIIHNDVTECDCWKGVAALSLKVLLFAVTYGLLSPKKKVRIRK